jgi:hypothetical protein
MSEAGGDAAIARPLSNRLMGFATILAGLLLLDAASAETTSPQRRTFTALWTNTTAGDVDRREMEATVRTALEPLGVSVTWKAGRGLEPSGPTTVRVVVIHSRKSALHARTMGSSNPGSSSPTIWVFYDQVLRVIGEPDSAALPHRARLGIAMGRVIGHEFVHLLAPGRGHDSAGLFAARLDGNALVAPRTRLSDALVQWFRTDRARAAQPAESRSADEGGPLPSVEGSEMDVRPSQGETFNVPVIDGWMEQ